MDQNSNDATNKLKTSVDVSHSSNCQTLSKRLEENYCRGFHLLVNNLIIVRQLRIIEPLFPKGSGDVTQSLFVFMRLNRAKYGICYLEY